ncbi:hypothetical protein Tco_0516268, partial [Tanacetum coccineum]
VIVNEEVEENEESEKYEDKSLQKKKRKGKKVEFVENKMVEDEMVESDKAEEPPIRKKKLDAPSFVDVLKLKGDMLVLKKGRNERQVSVKKGKQKINEGSLVYFKEGKKDKDEGVLMVVEKGKEVVLNEKVKRDPVNILTRMSPSHLKNVLDSLTTQQLIYCSSTVSPTTVVERKAPIFKHWSTELLKKRQVEEQKNGGFGQLPILEGLELIEKPKKNLKKKKSKQNILEIGSMSREEELEQFKSKTVQELNNPDDDNAMVVLDNGNDVPEESVKENEVSNEKDDVTEKQKDVEKMFELDGKNTLQVTLYFCFTF